MHLIVQEGRAVCITFLQDRNSFEAQGSVGKVMAFGFGALTPHFSFKLPGGDTLPPCASLGVRQGLGLRVSLLPQLDAVMATFSRCPVLYCRITPLPLTRKATQQAHNRPPCTVCPFPNSNREGLSCGQVHFSSWLVTGAGIQMQHPGSGS